MEAIEKVMLKSEFIRGGCTAERNFMCRCAASEAALHWCFSRVLFLTSFIFRPLVQIKDVPVSFLGLYHVSHGWMVAGWTVRPECP